MATKEVRVGIVGCGGRMGRMLVAEAMTTDGVVIVGGTEVATALHGLDLGELAGVGSLGIPVGGDSAALIAAADAVIDFTSPAATVRHARLSAERGRALVIGTTGLDPDQTRAVHAAAEQAPILWAPNMSLGVNLMLGLVEQVARALGPDYDIEVLEMHHRLKVDAPSGTALGLGRAAAAGRGAKLEDLWVKTRDGHTGQRDSGTIGFATLRGGDVVGDHTVMFAGGGERIEITHKASDRRIYARGALRAAIWAAGQKPGLYGMKDVLGI